ncbi:M20/M25/M40 family metallo-hydrolase [Alienimonas californiensis]|uniref:Acetylornithine deacetylase n=1 Tax=Alienimonas californiensis TaxID=2527989 RepID=A0A517P7L2_9PLAN|nr:M20/M25/M40 family metallo-hydrolase [Alienimonas californiensis]QDT15345.1 Acetylornithine deacetylase [Alienimonas californiensis]
MPVAPSPVAQSPADPLPLARELIAAASVSRDSNAAAAAVCEAALAAAGFAVERTVYRDARGVEKVNLLARLGPAPVPGAGERPDRPGFVWLGHTDVVPAAEWTGPGTGGRPGAPFEPTVTDDRLYGRGACDMKGPVAAAIAAAARLHADSQRPGGAPLTAPLWIGLTADEEIGFEGAKELVARSAAYLELRAANPPGIIGEPTSLTAVHAHKGSHLLTAIARGVAAHSSTAAGVNANLRLIPFLADLLPLIRRTETDPALQNPAFDPPGLSWNLTLSDGETVLNVTPERATATIYSRPVPGVDDGPLVAEFLALAAKHGLETIDDRHAGPFHTDPDAAFPTAVCELLGQSAPRTVCYGTDGGVFASPAVPGQSGGGLTNLLVLGPGSIAQAHTVAEFISLDQLRRGCDLYETLFRRYCVG